MVPEWHGNPHQWSSWSARCRYHRRQLARRRPGRFPDHVGRDLGCRSPVGRTGRHRGSDSQWRCRAHQPRPVRHAPRIHLLHLVFPRHYHGEQWLQCYDRMGPHHRCRHSTGPERDPIHCGSRVRSDPQRTERDHLSERHQWEPRSFRDLHRDRERRQHLLPVLLLLRRRERDHHQFQQGDPHVSYGRHVRRRCRSLRFGRQLDGILLRTHQCRNDALLP